MRIYQINYKRQSPRCFKLFLGDSCTKFNKRTGFIEISVCLNVSILLADGTNAKNCTIQEEEAYAVITGSFLNQFGITRVGHDPLPHSREVAKLVDVVEIRFDPDLCIGDEKITFLILTIVRNERLQKDITIIIATNEIQGGQFRISKGRDVVYEVSMNKLRALKHNHCSIC
jgi:hypothetical protein